MNFPNQTNRSGLAIALVTTWGGGSNYCRFGTFVQNNNGGLFPGAVLPVVCHNSTGTLTDQGYQAMVDYPDGTCVGGM